MVGIDLERVREESRLLRLSTSAYAAWSCCVESEGVWFGRRTDDELDARNSSDLKLVCQLPSD